MQRDGCGLKKKYGLSYLSISQIVGYICRSEGGLPVFYDYMMDSYRNEP